MKQCSKCGFQNDEQNTVCSSCQEPLGETTAELSKQLEKLKTSDTQKNRFPVKQAVIAAVLLLTVLSAILVLTHRPAQQNQPTVDKNQSVIVTEQQGQETSLAPRPEVSDESIKNLLLDYMHHWALSVNSGDFSIVRPYLIANSPLYQSQMELCTRYYNEGIREEFMSGEIHSITWDGASFLVKAQETYAITKDGVTEQKTYRWTYTVKPTPSLGLSDIGSY